LRILVVLDGFAGADGTVELSAAALRRAPAKMLGAWEPLIVNALRRTPFGGTSTEPAERAAANGGLRIQVHPLEHI
jgi:hypothetical protein